MEGENKLNVTGRHLNTGLYPSDYTISIEGRDHPFSVQCTITQLQVDQLECLFNVQDDIPFNQTMTAVNVTVQVRYVSYDVCTQTLLIILEQSDSHTAASMVCKHRKYISRMLSEIIYMYYA